MSSDYETFSTEYRGSLSDLLKCSKSIKYAGSNDQITVQITTSFHVGNQHL